MTSMDVERETAVLLRDKYLLKSFGGREVRWDSEVLCEVYRRLLLVYDDNYAGGTSVEGETTTKALCLTHKYLRLMGLSYLAPSVKNLTEKSRALRIISAIDDKIGSRYNEKQAARRARLLVKEEQKVKYLKEKRNLKGAISCQKSKEEAVPSQENVNPESPSREVSFAHPTAYVALTVQKVLPSAPKSPRPVDSSIPTGRQLPRTPLRGHQVPRIPLTGHHLPRTPLAGHKAPRTLHTGGQLPETLLTGHKLSQMPRTLLTGRQLPRTPLKSISSQNYQSSSDSNEINASIPKATVASKPRKLTISAEARPPQTATKMKPSPYNSKTQSSPASHEIKLLPTRTRAGSIPFRSRTNPSQDDIKPIPSPGNAEEKDYIPTGHQIPRTPKSVGKVCQIHGSGSLTSQVTGDTCNTSEDDQAMGLNSPIARGTLEEGPFETRMDGMMVEQSEHSSSRNSHLHLSPLTATYNTPGSELTDPIYKQPVKSPAQNVSYLPERPSVPKDSGTVVNETFIFTCGNSLHIEETLCTSIAEPKPKINENTLSDAYSNYKKQGRQKSLSKELTVVEWLRQDKCLKLFGSEESSNDSVKDEHIQTKHHVEPLTSVCSNLSTTPEPFTPLSCIDSVAKLAAVHVLSPPAEYKDQVDNSEVEKLEKQVMKEGLEFPSDTSTVFSGGKHIPPKINYDESLLNEVPVKTAIHKNIEKLNGSPLKMCEAEEIGSVLYKKSRKLQLPSKTVMDCSMQIISKATLNTHTIRNTCSENRSISLSTNQVYCLEDVEISDFPSEETVEQQQGLCVSNKKPTDFTHEESWLKQGSHMRAEKKSRSQSAVKEEKYLGSSATSTVDISWDINDSLEIFTKSSKGRKEKSGVKRSSKTYTQWKTPVDEAKDKKPDYSEDDEGQLRQSHDKNDSEDLEIGSVQHTKEKSWKKADVIYQNTENDGASLAVKNIVTTRKRESARRGKRNEISAQSSFVMDISETKKTMLCKAGEGRARKVNNDKEESNKVDEMHVSKVEKLVIDQSIKEDSMIQLDKINEITKELMEKSIICNEDLKAKKGLHKKKRGHKLVSEIVGNSEEEPVAEAAETSKDQTLKDMSNKMEDEVCEGTEELCITSNKQLKLTEIEDIKVSKRKMYEVYESTEQGYLDKNGHLQMSKESDEVMGHVDSKQVSITKTAKASANQSKREVGKRGRKEIRTEDCDEENQIDEYVYRCVTSREKKVSRNDMELDVSFENDSSQTEERGTRKTKVIGSAIIPQTLNQKHQLTTDGIHLDGEPKEEHMISERVDKKRKTSRKCTTTKNLKEHNESPIIKSWVLLEIDSAVSTGKQSDSEGCRMKMKYAKQHPQELSETVNVSEKQSQVPRNTGFSAFTSDDAFLEFASKASRKVNVMQSDDVNPSSVVHEEIECNGPKGHSGGITKRGSRPRKKKLIESTGTSAMVCSEARMDLNDTWSVSPIMKLPHRGTQKANPNLKERQKEQNDILKEDEWKKDVEVDHEERQKEKDLDLEQEREEIDIDVKDEPKKKATVLEGEKKQVHPERAQRKSVNARKARLKSKQTKANTKPHEPDIVDSNSILVNEGKLEQDRGGRENQAEGCTVKTDKERGGKKVEKVMKRVRKNDNLEKQSTSRKYMKGKNIEKTAVPGERRPTRGTHKKGNAANNVVESAGKENDELCIKTTKKGSCIGVTTKSNSKATELSSSCKSEVGHNLKVDKKCSEESALGDGSSALNLGRRGGRKCKMKALEAISNILNQSDDAVSVGTKRY